MLSNIIKAQENPIWAKKVTSTLVKVTFSIIIKKAHQFHVKETKINILVQEPDRPIKDPPTLYFSETSYQVDLKTKMFPEKIGFDCLFYRPTFYRPGILMCDKNLAL